MLFKFKNLKYKRLRVISKSALALMMVFHIDQQTSASEGDIDALLNQAQKNGNLRLNEANKEARIQFDAADSSYRESSAKNQQIYNSLVSNHNALIDRQKELAAQQKKEKQQLANAQAMTASSNQTVGQTIYVSKGDGVLKPVGSFVGVDASNTNGGGSSSTNTIGSTAKSNKKIANAVPNCLIVDSTSNSLADFLINRCSQKITVQWISQSDCSTGCMEWVGTKQSINKLKGHTLTAVCPYPYSAYIPNAPTPQGYRWNGGNYECVNW